MAIVRAGPNQYLLVGRKGVLENRGSAVQVFLRPGTIYVLVPSTKQEAAFEFTQETKDGIPLRFKGTVHLPDHRPRGGGQPCSTSAAATADRQITTLLTHVCLGELRHAVSHMTMVECIEQRKTTLSGVVDAALRRPSTTRVRAGTRGASRSKSPRSPRSSSSMPPCASSSRPRSATRSR